MAEIFYVNIDLLSNLNKSEEWMVDCTPTWRRTDGIICNTLLNSPHQSKKQFLTSYTKAPDLITLKLQALSPVMVDWSWKVWRMFNRLCSWAYTRHPVMLTQVRLFGFWRKGYDEHSSAPSSMSRNFTTRTYSKAMFVSIDYPCNRFRESSQKLLIHAGSGVVCLEDKEFLCILMYMWNCNHAYCISWHVYQFVYLLVWVCGVCACMCIHALNKEVYSIGLCLNSICFIAMTYIAKNSPLILFSSCFGSIVQIYWMVIYYGILW